MAGESKPISARELIRYLPDLLTGKEPVIDDPAIQHFIREDPEGRAALYVITETAAAMTVGAETLRAPIRFVPSTLAATIKLVRRHARHRFAELLFQAGADSYHRAMILRGEGCQFDWLTVTAPDREESKSLVARYSDQLGLTKAFRLELQGSLAEARTLGRDPITQLARAHRLFDANTKVAPEHEGANYMRVMTRVCVRDDWSPDEWRAFSMQFAMPDCRGGALGEAVRLNMEAGSWSRAGEDCAVMEHLTPFNPVCVGFSTVIAVAAGDEARLERMIGRFAGLGVREPDRASAVEMSIAGAAESLRSLESSARQRARVLIRRLPDRIAQTMIGGLR